LDDRLGPHRGDRLGQAAQSVANQNAHTFGAPVLDLGQHVSPVLGVLAAFAGPQAQDVPGAINSDTDHHIDRTVRHLAFADLHEHGVNEDHRIHTIEWPVLPSDHALQHPVGDPGDRLLRHPGAIDLRHMSADLPMRQSLGRQRTHQRVHTVQSPATLSTQIQSRNYTSVIRDLR
jgi:hypothetical protein